MTSTSLSLFDLQPGNTLLGRFLLKAPLRESGIATTFEAEDSESGLTGELQVFPGGLFEDAEQGAAFASCMQAWVGTEESCIQRIHSAQALDDGAALVFAEIPRGQDLRSMLEAEGPVESAKVVDLATSLLKGLSALHGAGLVHGDIKPASIYVGEEALLVDGGITPAMWAAKHLGTRTALIGTPFYAPIEQFTGDSPDELSDLYNLATVMYELLTGVLPWSGKGYIEVFQSKMQAVPPSMTLRAPEVEVSRELEEVVSQGLFASRRERHPSADVFLRRLTSAAIE